MLCILDFGLIFFFSIHQDNMALVCWGEDSDLFNFFVHLSFFLGRLRLVRIVEKGAWLVTKLIQN